jgi:dTDP-4-dehydrorhamnose 3,5-epimerase
MNIINCGIYGPKLIYPEIFKDERGFFFETWQNKRYINEGVPDIFVQDSISLSKKGVKRGLHFQNPNTQAKLVSVIKGEIFDVAVDIRFGSPTFSKWVGKTLDDKTYNQFYIPKGFAHGYCVLSNEAIILYKLSDYYTPSSEKGIFCDDPDIGINWPNMKFLMNSRDTNFPLLKYVPKDFLPEYIQE